MVMQFKTVTQMTQMTQSHADILTWCMLAPACNMLRHGRSAGWPLAIPTMLGGVPVGPAAKGQQKRTGCEQFLFFNFLL
jgi:hypothetical protein